MLPSILLSNVHVNHLLKILSWFPNNPTYFLSLVSWNIPPVFLSNGPTDVSCTYYTTSNLQLLAKTDHLTYCYSSLKSHCRIISPWKLLPPQLHHPESFSYAPVVGRILKWSPKIFCLVPRTVNMLKIC